jgi:alkanesulfonate monooxygenase SsuD/methylene tetrahydromethanopterin reductase-like flavin-dependent oxidoreductase (luciferase family)
VLAFLEKCFAADVVEANGQPFLFRPRPAKPPVLVGGRAPHALERATRYGDGWLPMGLSPSDVVAAKTQYARLTEKYGKPPGTITLMTALPLHDASQARDQLEEYRAAGVDRIVCAVRYRTYTEYAATMTRLATVLGR